MSLLFFLRPIWPVLRGSVRAVELRKKRKKKKKIVETIQVAPPDMAALASEARLAKKQAQEKEDLFFLNFLLDEI